MIKKHSDDPDVAAAAAEALTIIDRTLSKLPKATEFDYGGHHLKLGEYDVCEQCTRPIAEAQAAEQTLRTEADLIDDPTIQEHLELAAEFFQREAESAIVRAEMHNGFGTEPIIDRLLGYQFERGIHDDYHHTHHGGTQ
jgi:hypothetical protein